LDKLAIKGKKKVSIEAVSTVVPFEHRYILLPRKTFNLSDSLTFSWFCSLDLILK
jgi:hypothetical protein